MSNRVSHRLAHLRPRVEEKAAVDFPIRVSDRGRPVPKEPTGGGEDHRRHAEGPDEEVAEEVDGGVEGAAGAEREEDEGYDVDEEGEGGLL